MGPAARSASHAIFYGGESDIAVDPEHLNSCCLRYRDEFHDSREYESVRNHETNGLRRAIGSCNSHWPSRAGANSSIMDTFYPQTFPRKSPHHTQSTTPLPQRHNHSHQHTPNTTAIGRNHVKIIAFPLVFKKNCKFAV